MKKSKHSNAFALAYERIYGILIFVFFNKCRRKEELKTAIEGKTTMDKRENFGTRLGFILVSAGCAVGLGNVWKFPYVCGQNGGAAFIVLYLICLALLGWPILICEYAVGRASRHSTAKAFHVLEPKGARPHRYRWFSVAGNYLLMMFYTMVCGWIINYALRMLTGNLKGKNPG